MVVQRADATRPCRALLGLDGSETRPYMACAVPQARANFYFAIGTFTAVLLANAFASS